MFEQFFEQFQQGFQESISFDLQWPRLLLILLFFLLAYFVHRLARRISRRLVHFGGLTRLWRDSGPERLKTLQGLLANVISFIAFLVAFGASLSFFIGATNMIWLVGLFSAAFGLGARPLVSDFLHGISFIFEDTFDVGEKVELPGLPGGTIQGVIEDVKLRLTLVRSQEGELYTVPNGEIRVVRNFSRGKFSSANITLNITGRDLSRAIPLLELLGKEAVHLLPNLLEPWQVVSKSGELGSHTELTLITKTRFGRAAEMRPRLLALVQQRLVESEIELKD